MAEPAVTFLLENVHKHLVDHENLISGAESELQRLQKELELMKAFLIESANKREKGEVFRQHERQIREVVYRAEDTLDACLSQAAVDKSKSSTVKNIKPRRLDLASKVKALRENEVRPIFDRAIMGFATLPIADVPASGSEKRKTEEKTLTAVTFLLEKVHKIQVDNKNLVLGAEAELRILQKELELMKAFLVEFANKREKGRDFEQLERQIEEVVYRAEGTIEVCLSQAASGVSNSSFAKKVKAFREKEVQPIFDRVRLGFARLPMADETAAGSQKRKTKETSIPLLREDNVVGFDGEADMVIKYLTEDSEELEVISIIGMPGLGKTTLAWKIYRDQKIQFEFPTLLWVYVSQDYNIKDVFLTILKKFTQQDLSHLDQNELARKVRSYLEKSKFLLFMDDVWTGEAWGRIEAALPKTNKFGKVLITSCDEKVARKASTRDPHRLGFLELKQSWELLQLEVFNRLDACPEDLKVLGKDIAMHCGGVPLAIVVIGGILAEKFSSADMKLTWEKVSSSVTAYLQNDKQKRTENIILLRYNKLPYNLRNCFLYLGMFPEDSEISAWKLTRLWIAEGFIQQRQEKSLEEVAEEYLEELIARNLVMVDKTKATGEVKTCRVHDMIRKFCKTQAAFEKQNLFQEVKKTTEGTFYPLISEISSYRRLCVHSYVEDFLRKKPKGPTVRSFLCFSKEPIIFQPDCIPLIPDAFNLLRVLEANPIKFTKFPSKINQLIHLRYIALSGDQFNCLPEAVSKLWNLQTIRIDTLSRTFEIKADIWNMMQLRHFKTKAAIIISKNAKGKGGENLQTLSRLSNSSQCGWKEVLNKASNLKNLGFRGRLTTIIDSNCLARLDRLHKLKLVYDVFPEVTSHLPLLGLPTPDKFPPNLRILQLSSTFLDWKHISPLGWLPSLEVLKLKENAFMGKFWKANGGSFPSLEVLHISQTDLEIWTAPKDPLTPFPKLRCLVLKNCEKLQEIPSVLEQSLQVLDIERVTKSIVKFAKGMEGRKQLSQGQQRGKSGGFKLRIAPGDGR